MKVLVVGSGAREHALVWKLAASPAVTAVYCAPGNAGTAALAHSVPLAADRIRELVGWAKEQRIDLVVVGPEAPLAAGLADTCAAAGLAVFGPSAAAAQIEASKVWAKGFMERHGIPTARAHTCNSVDEARRALKEFTYPLVIKADGLAAGKGVEVVGSEEAARETLERYMARNELGAAGQRVVIEEFLSGEELSVFALYDGQDLVLAPPVRDYKRLGDGDRGPNTGGMGGYAPVARADAELMARIRAEILEPTLAGLEQEGRPYRGVLYGGLMLTAQGPRVLEFNCRFGDPETQVLLPLLESDLAELLLAVPNGSLGLAQVRWSPGASCAVVLASQGYPGPLRTGVPIEGLDEVEPGMFVFHAGTTRRSEAPAASGWRALRQGLGLGGGESDVLTAGGRVLTLVGTGATLAEARERAYRAVEVVRFEGRQYRTDIGADAGTRGRGDAEKGPDLTPRPPSLPGKGEPDRDRSGTPPLAGEGPGERSGSASPTPLVSIIMGSESDRQVMEPAASVLESLGIAHEVLTMSAHRTPERVRAFAQGAEARGIRVIIAGAGLAAHLPGVIASWTSLPVIGVPLAAGELRGLDALYAIVQMPPGVPVATVGIGAPGAKNAAYIAAAMLSLSDDTIRQRYQQFRKRQMEG
ncbi:MAG: phosphoribosylamine--glycine ligase [Chloroflexi bacterium]|nr:phosphoribosylamine--glycine ligase [Chloroflexota bacterium]